MYEIETTELHSCSVRIAECDQCRLPIDRKDCDDRVRAAYPSVDRSDGSRHIICGVIRRAYGLEFLREDKQ